MTKKKTTVINDSVKKEKSPKDSVSKNLETIEKTTPSNKKRKAKIRSKKYQEIIKFVDKNKFYSPQETIKLAKKTSRTFFDGNLEVHLTTSTIGELGELVLPHFRKTKEKKIAIVDSALLEKIKKGDLDFDILISTPQFMSKLVPFARLLGPKGLMPNPKNGTLTDKPKEALKKFQSGGTKIKTEKKAPVVHLILGKISQNEKELLENLQALVKTIQPENIKKIVLNATMGPGIKLDLSSFRN